MVGKDTIFRTDLMVNAMFTLDYRYMNLLPLFSDSTSIFDIGTKFVQLKI